MCVQHCSNLIRELCDPVYALYLNFTSNCDQICLFSENIGYFSFSNVHLINLEILLRESHVRTFWKHRARLAFASWWSAGEVTGRMGRILTSSHFNNISYVELLINISLENLRIAPLDSPLRLTGLSEGCTLLTGSAKTRIWPAAWNNL